jgi:hypothetical protein
MPGNGHNSPLDLNSTVPDNNQDETQEELQAVHKKLSDLTREDGILVSLTKQQLSLLQQMLHSPDDGDKFTKIALTLDFESEDERRKVVAAFYEAVRLGMNTDWNISDALSRCATNRKNSHRTSRVGFIGETLSHSKFTSNVPRGKESGSSNPRSPLSG